MSWMQIENKFILQIWTPIQIYIMNKHLDMYSYNKCKLEKKMHITNVNCNMDSCHRCTFGYGFISEMQTWIRICIKNAKLNIDSYHKCETWMWIHITNLNPNMDSYHGCKIEYRFISCMQASMWIHIMIAKLNTDFYHQCKLQYGFISWMWTWIWIRIMNWNLSMDSWHKCKIE